MSPRKDPRDTELDSSLYEQHLSYSAGVAAAAKNGPAYVALRQENQRRQAVAAHRRQSHTA